jgi:hypothetical protein
MSRCYLATSAALLLLAVPARGAHAQAALPIPITTSARKPEAHPRIRSAIRELEAAKVELERAPHDFGGHRADAVLAVDRAIAQLRLALRYDAK